MIKNREMLLHFPEEIKISPAIRCREISNYNNTKV